MRFTGLLKTILLSAGIAFGLHHPAAAQAGAETVALQETSYGSWTFFARPDPQSKKTEYTIYNSALKTENVALMLRCTPNGLWVFLFDGVERKTDEAFKVTFKYDGKTSVEVEGDAVPPDPIIMLRISDTLLENLTKAKTFTITAAGKGTAQTYAFKNAEAQAVFPLFALNCQE